MGSPVNTVDMGSSVNTGTVSVKTLDIAGELAFVVVKGISGFGV